MAQPMKKESQPVGHAMIGETLDTPILQCDLLEEIQSLHKEDAWLQGTGPSSKTLVKHSDLRIVLLAMRRNMSMHEHKTAARISVQTLTGHIRLRLPDRTVELPPGGCLYSINAFRMMSKQRKIAPCCSPCPGTVDHPIHARLINGRNYAP